MTNSVFTVASLGFSPFGLTFQWLVLSKIVYPNSPLVARVIDTTSGQLPVDWIIKVEGEDEFTSTHQTFH